MTLKKKIIIAVIILSVGVITALLMRAWFYAADKVSRPESYKEYITKTVSETLKRDVTYETGTAALTLRKGLAMQFFNLIIREKDGSSDFLKVDQASVRINILPLLINRLVFGEIVLHQPRVSLKRDSSGILNIDDLLNRKEDEKAPKFRKIIIENGSVNFLDQSAGHEDLETSLEDVNGRLNALFWTDNYHFHMTTTVVENKNKAKLALSGFISLASADKPLYESKIRASVHLKGTDLKHYVAYLKKYTSIQHVAGKLDADITVSGKFSDFKSKGTVVVKNSSLDYPGVFNGVIQPRLLEVNYSMKRDDESLNIDIGHLAIDNFNAKGSFDIDDLDKKDPLLKAEAITKVFSFKEVSPRVPWGIIQKDVSNFIQDYIKDGKFRLMEGKLKGRLSQIADINGKEGVDVVSIRAEVDRGVLEVDRSAPVFHDISGILELKKRVFSLRRMKGKFGNSPCTLEGNISDFARPQKNIYTAYMRMQPAREEILWLLGKEKFRDSGFKGNSILFLSGKGTDEKYHINASWDLADAAYVYPDVLEKPKARKNHITAAIVIDDQAINFTSFKYYLPPVNITAAAKFFYSGKIPLAFNIQSGMFDIRNAVPVLPALRDLKPAGNCFIAVSGRGDLSEPSSVQWNGDVSLSGISVQPLANVKPLQGLTGKASFKGNRLETSLFKARLGESTIQGNLKIDDLANPNLICQFNTNLLHTKDLGLQNPKGMVNLYAVTGQIGLEDKLFHIRNLSFILGQSSFNLSAAIRDWENPNVTADLSSPYVTSDDLIRLISFEYPEKDTRTSSSMDLKATLNINDGRIGDIDFKKLYADMRFNKGILDIETLEADVFDGKFKSKGKVYVGQDGRNRYETNISIHKASLEKIQNYLEMGDRTITGNLSFSGDVSAIGSNVDEFKYTAAGTFDVRAEKGVMKKFSILSKIFSILNVYQLVKFQLPDMAKDGMPYKKITFHTTLKDGTFTSNDFFIDSDAIQFSATGNVDFIKKKIDCVVGAHPLQTLDLIASKIPIAGWVITDERGKLITVNFKIGGTWDNPDVTTITAQSIGKGTLDIFKRIFLLPEKLVTDTGDVILGR